MALTNLDMDVMRTLLAAHQLGSLNRAAERVGRSQSAISQQFRKLEDQVGLPLFRRQGRGLVLTDAGDTILSYAKRILDLNDEAIRSVRGTALEGSVRFGLPSDFAETWLPGVLGAFKRTHPAVRVEIAVEPNRLLLERLDKEELDLVLAMGNQARADAERVASLPMTWIGPDSSDTTTTSCKPLDLALYNAPCMFRRAGVQALEDANISWRLAYTTASLQSLWAGVAAGLGITVRTATDIPPSLRRLGVADGLPELPTIDLCLHGAHRKLSPALEQLKQVVLESAIKHLAT